MKLMLAFTWQRVELQPFDIVFVDDADLGAIVLVPLSKLLPHLRNGWAIEPHGLDLGHVVPQAFPVAACIVANNGPALPRKSWRQRFALSISRSRMKAGAKGFFILVRPDRYGEPRRFDTMTSQPSAQACLKMMAPSLS
jgi:hypothetical protein